MNEEKRANIRAAVNLPAKWYGASGLQEFRVVDISLGGCFVSTTGRMDLEEPITLEIRLPSGRWMRFSGEVISCQAGIGFGILFDSLTGEQEFAIMELLSDTH